MEFEVGQIVSIVRVFPEDDRNNTEHLEAAASIGTVYHNLGVIEATREDLPDYAEWVNYQVRLLRKDTMTFENHKWYIHEVREFDGGA